jgi:hypothetical protein
MEEVLPTNCWYPLVEFNSTVLMGGGVIYKRLVLTFSVELQPWRWRQYVIQNVSAHFPGCNTVLYPDDKMR